jgi:hypothetical protein
LRSVLVQIGKQGLARNPAYSNPALGIERGSRIGTKRPLSDEAIRAFQERMEQLARPGIAETLELQRALGLRAVEAIRAGKPDTLSRWERELREHGRVHVVEGTKGGRPRDAHPANLERAREAIGQALSVLESTQQRYLVTRADGAAAGLKGALGVYRNLCHRAKLQSHAARYAFAQARVQGYGAEGYSEREAQAATGSRPRRWPWALHRECVCAPGLRPPRRLPQLPLLNGAIRRPGRLSALRLREQPAVHSGFNAVMNTLNLRQAAAFLHMHPEEVRSRAKRGLIPGAKVGRKWVFLRG